MMEVVMEIDDSLGESYMESPEGLIIRLKQGIVIFVTGGKIGIFHKSTLFIEGGDFSKIPTSTIRLVVDEEEISEISSAIH